MQYELNAIKYYGIVSGFQAWDGKQTHPIIIFFGIILTDRWRGFIKSTFPEVGLKNKKEIMGQIFRLIKQIKKR